MYLNGLAEDARYLTESPAIKRLTADTNHYVAEEKPTFSQLEGNIEAEAFALMNAFGEARPDLAYVFLGLETGTEISRKLSNTVYRIRTVLSIRNRDDIFTKTQSG
ncbi:hypothetical protein [Amphritea sp.]|uniref:hypothetical protein n=1 Tax=Amphritea sp. TaxID=1872502 RepID=UPI003A942233